MSVIINMKMPDACPNCPFVMAYYCLLIGISGDNEVTNYINKRHPNCPLVEIPTSHGRLIDATFEENHYASMLLNPTPDVTEQDKKNARIIIEALRMARTVVEAEGSEK